MADPTIEYDSTLQRAALALLLHERLIATVHARTGDIMSSNARFAELVGRTVDEVTGSRLAELWQTSATAVDRMLDGARDGEYLEQVVEVVDVNDRHRWLRSRARRRRSTGPRRSSSST